MSSFIASPQTFAPGRAPVRRMNVIDRITSLTAGLWATDRLLTGAGLVLLALAVPTSLGIWLDPREITGAPAWLKPTKFAISTGVYSLTLAWIFQYLSDFPRTRRVVSRMTAAIFFLEIAVIDLQAWRGTTSHFNVGTPLDATLFSAMGIGIALQTLASVAVAVALWRQTFADRALGWALRLGMVITIAGAASGGLMTRPTATQLEAMQASQTVRVVGAHTVGAPDGGPGLPLTGWSTTHGDVRVPHFIGLHALQLLPLITVLFRRQSATRRVQLTWTAAAVYTLVFVGLMVQALRGLPLLAIG